MWRKQVQKVISKLRLKLQCLRFEARAVVYAFESITEVCTVISFRYTSLSKLLSHLVAAILTLLVVATICEKYAIVSMLVRIDSLAYADQAWCDLPEAVVTVAIDWLVNFNLVCLIEDLVEVVSLLRFDLRRL